MQKIFLFFGFFIFLIFGARAANAATLYFSPSSGNFTVGNVFTVNVLVNTENADINNAEATVNFPSGLLEVISISKSGSIFSLWVEEPAFSNSTGTLSLNGGLPTPGFKGASGKVIGAVFRVKKAGSASLVFSSAAVRANDGYGTNVFKTGMQALFNLISEEKPLLPEEELSPAPIAGRVPAAPQVSSPTHPDQSKWYSNKNPTFEWELPSEVKEVRLVLGKKPSSIPQVSYIPPISEKVLTDLEDGVWYLNGRFRTSEGWGPITSFRFQIDTEAPDSFKITRVDTNDPTNPRPELLFESNDSTSGIDRYEMKIGEGDWFSIEPGLAGKPYKLPLQAPGTREITIKAFDRAGNTTTTTT
ncbi:MAG: cohesin domain-containing protein, partial [bacterium]|nr:cohesin domain-containing protein [bacterium]